MRDAGFEVVTASGGDEALRIARAVRPDAIFSDVLMGDVDGFWLCRQLRTFGPHTLANKVREALDA